jgi:hypothetical protein
MRGELLYGGSRNNIKHGVLEHIPYRLGWVIWFGQGLSVYKFPLCFHGDIREAFF